MRTPGFSKDAYAAARRHLVRLGLRAMNDRQASGHPVPELELLELVMLDYVLIQLGHLINIVAPGEPRLTGAQRRCFLTSHEAIERLARDSAEAALRAWDPGFIARRRAAGTRGGQISKRGPVWDDIDLIVLTALDGYTAAQQAEILGVSRSTVFRMRAELKRLDSSALSI